MKKLILALFIIGISLSGYAGIKPKDVVGKWKYQVDTGGEYMTGLMKFTEKDGQLVGEVVSDDGYTFPFTKVEIKEENNLYLEAKTDYNHYKIDVKVDGNKFSGTGSSYEGEAPIKGEKVKE